MPIEKIPLKKTKQIETDPIQTEEPKLIDTPIDDTKIPSIPSDDSDKTVQENKTNTPIEENISSQESKQTETNPTQVEEPKQINTIPPSKDTKKEKPKDLSAEFSIKNPELKTTLQPFLDGISFENIINTVNAIRNTEARKTVQEYLGQGFVVLAQEYIGMYRDSQYADNKATGKINQYMLERIAQPDLLEKGEKLRPYLSTDVWDLYLDFLSGNEKNNKKNYAIISKKDYTLYVFNSDHKLLSKHNILLGKARGDTPPKIKQGGSVFTTPGGIYTIDARTKKPEEYAGPGDYLQLKPRDRNYPVADFSIGIHTYFNTKGNREDALEQTKANKRVTNGCINTLMQGSIYDNLEMGSTVSIANES